MNALAIVSDSGTLPEESSFYLSIGHPIAAVCIRTSTERPEAMEAGDFILAGISTNELLQATDMAIRMKRDGVLGNSKWEMFIVVHGHGLIQERNINTGETVEFEVGGDKIEAIHMIPGWTHNIINLSETENLVTVMTCNEIFDSAHPDTFGEPV